ncbi:MAG TPA: phosphotransferase [Acidimicrobiales bacterium]|nr:phosphotransferase [Acidimicrobiales bacterium]
MFGPLHVVADHTWPEWQEAAVVELLDQAGTRMFAKQHRGADRYRRELTAYQRWVPALGARAPRVLASHDAAQLLVVSAVPGAPPRNWRDSEVLVQAGRALATLHAAEDLGRLEDVVPAKQAELDYWLRRGPGLVDRPMVDRLRCLLASLEPCPAPDLVPCHGDFSPRNWLVDHGRLGVIDFGEAGPGAWVTDLGRVLFGWRLPPDGVEPLLDGYGRRPTDDELALLRATYAASIPGHIVWAREHRNNKFEASSRQLLDSILAGEFG